MEASTAAKSRDERSRARNSLYSPSLSCCASNRVISGSAVQVMRLSNCRIEATIVRVVEKTTTWIGESTAATTNIIPWMEKVCVIWIDRKCKLGLTKVNPIEYSAPLSDRRLNWGKRLLRSHTAIRATNG